MMAQCYVAIWTELMYEICLQRCSVMYKEGKSSLKQAESNILFRVAARFQGCVADFLAI